MNFSSKGIKLTITAIMVALLLIGVGFSGSPVQAEADGEIAFVNLEEVFEAHPDKESAEEQLNQEAQELQQELEAQADELSQEEQQDLLQDYQEQLTQREQELIGEVLSDIEGIITELAEEVGAKVVLEGQNVLYGGYDLTPEIIEYLNQQ